MFCGYTATQIFRCITATLLVAVLFLVCLGGPTARPVPSQYSSCQSCDTCHARPIDIAQHEQLTLPSTSSDTCHTRPVRVSSATHPRVFRRFLACVSPKLPDYIPERHRHASFRRISCMCVPNQAEYSPRTTPSHEFSPDFLHVCPELPPFPTFFTTHPQVFADFLRVSPRVMLLRVPNPLEGDVRGFSEDWG